MHQSVKIGSRNDCEAENKMKTYRLGFEKDFDQYPAPIEVEGRPYFILKNGDVYLLASRICPHMGYPVEVEKGEIVCFLHDWTFDERTGQCNEIPHEKLVTHPVLVRDGEMIAMLNIE